MIQANDRRRESPMRRKALLAIAFAGGVLNSHLAAFSEPATKPESTDSEIQKIANDRKMSPKYRALHLLQLANGNLPDGTQCEVGAQLYCFQFAEIRHKSRARNDIDSFVSDYCQRIIEASNKSGLDSRPIPEEKVAFANKAVVEALQQLEKSTEKFATLSLYFIASKLFQRTGNLDGVAQCERVMSVALQTCEQDKKIDEGEIRAATSLLNQMANSLVPVYIPDRETKDDPVRNQASERGQQARVEAHTLEKFTESEKLKLRAIAIIDRLPFQNHLRRKAHRDLVLWYQQLGKNEKAEKEKQVLFDLVGIRDDSILYPQDGACGHVVWWERKGTVAYFGCGMG
jgi:hypothetical protein